MVALLQSDEEAFADMLAQKTNCEMLAEQKLLEGELQKAISRNETVLRMYEKLYEDNAMGKVSDEWFMQLSHKYEVERMELKQRIAELRRSLAELGSRQQGRDLFISAIRSFMRMDTLTAPLLRELVDHIDVFEIEGTGKDPRHHRAGDPAAGTPFRDGSAQRHDPADDPAECYGRAGPDRIQ